MCLMLILNIIIDINKNLLWMLSGPWLVSTGGDQDWLGEVICQRLGKREG